MPKSNSAIIWLLGRSQMRNSGSTSPRSMTSSSMPRPASISSVAAWVVAARGMSLTLASASNTRTGSPWRASASAAITPTGPPPAMRMGRGSAIGWLFRLEARDGDGLAPGLQVSRDQRGKFGGRVAEWIGAELGELFDELGIFAGLGDLGRDLVDDWLGGARGRHQSVPGDRTVARKAFRHGRHIGK